MKQNWDTYNTLTLFFKLQKFIFNSNLNFINFIINRKYSIIISDYD